LLGYIERCSQVSARRVNANPLDWCRDLLDCLGNDLRKSLIIALFNAAHDVHDTVLHIDVGANRRAGKKGCHDRDSERGFGKAATHSVNEPSTMCQRSIGRHGERQVRNLA
jgi:hypothetical protein